MKIPTALSLILIFGRISVTSLAQGTYLNGPGNNPPNALVVAPGGDIGIGTSAPRARLHVVSTGDYAGEFEKATPDANAWIKIVNDSRSYLVGVRGDTKDSFVIYDNVSGSDRIVVDPSGAIGIGTSNPQALLEVAGSIRCTVLDLVSDRNAKAGFSPVDAHALLEQLARLPISTWSYTNAPSVKHIGPVAQDFHAAFAVGSDEHHIATVDADGVALAAIQALYREIRRRDDQLAEKEVRLNSLEAQLRRLEEQMANLLESRDRREATIVSGTNAQSR